MDAITATALSLFGGSLAQPVAGAGMAAVVQTGTAAAPTIGDGLAAGPVPAAPFGDLLTDAVGQVEGLERQARSSIEGLISGKGVDVHEAMIASEKAEMGFELVLAVRGKALAAYQQVMGMQF